jgi:hypothetical protein
MKALRCRIFKGTGSDRTVVTRTAWAVFKYCGTKTATLRIKKNMKRLIYNLYQKKQTK